MLWNNKFMAQCLGTFRFTVTPSATRSSDPTTGCNTRCRVADGHNRRNWDVAWEGFCEWCGNKLCDWWSVCNILLVCRGEYFYDGCWAVFYVCECVELYLYVYLYENVDIFERYEVVFFILCLGVCIQDQIQMWLFFVIGLYRVIWSRYRNARYFII